jgi:hypothetical protein
VITLTVLVDVFILHCLAAQRYDSSKGLEDRNAVSASAVDIVHFARARILEEGLDKSRDIQGMDVVTYLPSEIAKYFVGASIHVALN